jgi:hypothetical protein
VHQDQDERLNVFVVPCGGAKLAAAAPARDLYTGSAFRQVLRDVVAEAAATSGPTRVMILSARYGLLDLDQVVDPYDVTMRDACSIDIDQLADQLADVTGGRELVEVWCFLPAAYRVRLADAAERVETSWVVTHDVYEAAPGIGYQKQAAKSLALLA